MDELIDIYNDNNEPLNVVKMRSEAHTSGYLTINPENFVPHGEYNQP